MEWVETSGPLAGRAVGARPADAAAVTQPGVYVLLGAFSSVFAIRLKMRPI